VVPPANEKDPKDEATTEEKPKRRAPRRKPKTEEAAEPKAAAAKKPAAKKPAAKKPAAKKAAPKKAAAAKADLPTEADVEETALEAPVAEADATADAPAQEDEAPAPKPRRTRRKAAAETPAAPAAQPRRAARDYGDTPPMVRAHAKYVRTSARKARLVCDHIRGKSVLEARAILAHASRDVARDWSKLLESAVANAEHNHELIGDELRIHAVKADEGPTLKRFRPRAMGRATKIRKRTSHLSITLTPKDGE